MTNYLTTFFKEKDLAFATWELIDDDGMTHIITNEVVIEVIGNASQHEQKGIESVIRKIDFHNGDVNDYLKHLAGALINA